MTFSDNIERLQQRHARFHHGGKLPRKKCDILLGNLFSATPGLLFNLGVRDPLPTQRRADDTFPGCAHFALDKFSRLVFPFPGKIEELYVFPVFLTGCGGSHRYSLIKLA